MSATQSQIRPSACFQDQIEPHWPVLGGGLGLLDKFVQRGRRCIKAGVLQQLLVVEEVLGAVEPGHAIELAVVTHGAQRRIRNVAGDRIGEAVADVLHPAGRRKLRRPDRVHFDDVDIGATLDRGDDLVEQLVVLDLGLVDLDAGRRFEVLDERLAEVTRVGPQEIDDLFAAGAGCALRRCCWCGAARAPGAAALVVHRPPTTMHRQAGRLPAEKHGG